MTPEDKKCIILTSILLFIADMSYGMIVPTETVFAIELGASLTFIGIMSTWSMLVVLPLGMIVGPLSDRSGLRKILITLGFALFSIRGIIYFFAMNPIQMLAGKIIFSVAQGILYSTIFVYILSKITGPQRGMAIGVSSTVMGLGFALSPIIGGNIANIWGYRSSYLLSSLIAVLGIPLALTSIKNTSEIDSETSQKSSVKIGGLRRALIDKLKEFIQEFEDVIRNKDIITGSISSMFNSLTMSIVFSFAPIYAKSIGINVAEIGSAFSVRGLGSTLIRIPTGKLIPIVGARRLMAFSLLIHSISFFLISKSDIYLMVAIFLTLEGICWGVHFTASRVYMGEVSGRSKGTAIGISQTFGRICNLFIMGIMGILADTWGIATIFTLSATLCIVGGLFTLFGPRTAYSAKYLDDKEDTTFASS